MPLKKAKTRAQLLKEIREAVKEAEVAGVTDAQKLVKKIIESKHQPRSFRHAIFYFYV